MPLVEVTLRSLTLLFVFFLFFSLPLKAQPVKLEFKGKVLKVRKVKRFGRKGSFWWVVKVETRKGVMNVWLAPVWMYPSLSLAEGDRVKVVAFIPHYWRLAGFKGAIACKLEDETSREVVDFSFKPMCRRLKWGN